MRLCTSFTALNTCVCIWKHERTQDLLLSIVATIPLPPLSHSIDVVMHSACCGTLRYTPPRYTAVHRTTLAPDTFYVAHFLTLRVGVQLPLGSMDEVLNFAIEGCKQIYESMRSAVQIRVQEQLHTRGLLTL